LPSAIALILFALGLAHYGAAMPAGALHGLKVVAVAVVAQAVWGMARNLCRGVARVTLMLIAACVVLLEPSAWAQVGVIAAAGVGACCCSNRRRIPNPTRCPSPSAAAPARCGWGCSCCCWWACRSWPTGGPARP
jgi:chromate transporter